MAIGPLSGSASSLFKSSTGNALMQNILLARDNAFGKKDGSQGALNILDKLKSASNEESAERKEAARQKIERIKAQIQALRMMAAGDPKAAARQAARLARELATAGREYANAGGGADAVAAGAASAGATAAVTNADKAADTQEAQGVSPAVAGSDSVSVTQNAKETAENIADKEAVPQDSEDTATAADPAQTIREAVAEKINAAQKVITGGKADSEFAQELRRLMSDLRGIIDNAKQRLKDETGNDTNIDVQEAEKALRDAGDAATTIMSGGMTAMVMGGIDITV